MEKLNSLEKAVLKEAEKRFDDCISFLQRLVREPSVLGNEAGAQEVFFSRLQDLGLRPEKWDLDIPSLKGHPNFGSLDLPYKNRPNVTGVLPAGNRGGRSLILNGHIDVVSPEPVSNWSHDPWGAQIEGEWMYGRGAGDMKAGLAAGVLAVEAIRAAGAGLKGDVFLQSVIEEECTGNGTLACGQRGMRADAAIVTEPHGLQACLATMTVIWFRVRTKGRASHAHAADLAVNAIEKMYPVIACLRKLEAELNAEIKTPMYRPFAQPVNLNIGIIKGGDWPSTVPSACELQCRLSGEPGTSVIDLHARIEKAVAEGARVDPFLRENPPHVEFFGFRAEASVSDPATPPLRLLGECREVILGKPLAFHASTATTDQRFFLNNWGIPATSFGPSAEKIHAEEERVFIPSILDTAKVLALFALRWCGTEG
ncbi:MAG TPA: ArgE/DapE family deacylase [Thermodesulfobacteriota bacterium]|nr:ArgE/DapE family deacylase [Thermodesulfobacteriota bacterium]